MPTERTVEFERKVQPGIEIITGSMFSGKSDELILRLRRLPYAGYRVKAFKPGLDTRRGKRSINTESGNRYPATVISDSRQILKHVDGVDIVAIDEAQFFDKNLPKICLRLVKRGKRLLIACLNLDFRGETFGPMGQLMEMADHITMLHAFCSVCGREAAFSQRIVNGEPASYNEKIIEVGATERYQARCREHHEVPEKPIDNDILVAKSIDNEVYGKAEKGLRKRSTAIVKAFLKKRDFEELLRRARKEQIRIENEGVLLTISVPIMITDILGKMENGNEIVVKNSEVLGVFPGKNYIGTRLQASSCLQQLLNIGK